jgi:hypothetical protein
LDAYVKLERRAGDFAVRPWTPIQAFAAASFLRGKEIKQDINPRSGKCPISHLKCLGVQRTNDIESKKND